MVTMREHSVKVARSCSLLVAFALTQTLHGAAFGILSSGQAGVVSVPPGRTWNTGVFQPLSVYASPILDVANQYSIGGSTFTEGAHASLTMTGGSFHASAVASGSAGGDPSVQQRNAGGSAGFSGIWMDTLYIVGLPLLTPVDLLITNTLDSFNQVSVTPDTSNSAQVESILSINSVSSQLQNLNGGSNGLLTSSFIFHTFVGDSLQLEHQFVGEATAGTLFQARTVSSSVDALNTSEVFISVLTPGASYTTASGVGYTQQTGTPEVGSLWLAGPVLLVWCSRARHRSRRA